MTDTADQLAGIARQLDEVLALLRYNLKKPPTGTPRVAEPPSEAEIAEWLNEVDEAE